MTATNVSKSRANGSAAPYDLSLGLSSLMNLHPDHETDLENLPTVICSAFGPLGWSIDDTEQTIIDVKRHNRKWLRVCDPDKYEELMRGQNEKL
ncbi:hypothetical protein [uncultured Cohaesibacter sp.]|uniref:hypothetical protein n=1 Tax=uncultured Cohaesibacter sp. TaxID=1002546 RepID=UPI0029C8CCEC|nr:hypothetical protein [uncultured Cohaesibacter sp.]